MKSKLGSPLALSPKNPREEELNMNYAITHKINIWSTTLLFAGLFCFWMSGAWADTLPSSSPKADFPSLSLEELHRKYASILKVEDPETQQAQLKDCFQQYRQLCRQLPDLSAHLHYNLGTMALKCQEYGYAIFHLKSAYALNRSDSRILEHLERAKRQAKVAITNPQPQNLSTWLSQLWNQIPSLFWQVLTLAFSILGLAAAIFKKNSYAVFAFVLFGLSVAAGYARSQDIGVTKEAVLMSTYNPRSGLGPQYPGVLNGDGLKAGNLGRVLRQDAGWVEVLWYDAKRAWVPANVVNIIGE